MTKRIPTITNLLIAMISSAMAASRAAGSVPFGSGQMSLAFPPRKQHWQPTFLARKPGPDSTTAFLSTLPRGGQQHYEPTYDDRPSSSRFHPNEYSGRDGQFRDDWDEMDDRGMRTPSFGGMDDGIMSGIPMPKVIQTGNRRVGIPLLGVGAALTLLGISLFFNKTLMRLGNLCFVAGVPMTIGPGRTAGYFFQPKKARATGCLAAGLVLVFVGWPLIGILLELFGVLNLFGNMFPVAFAILKTMPVIGPLLRGDRQTRQEDNFSRGGRYQDHYDRDAYYDDRNYYEDGGQDDNNQRYY